MAKVNMIEAMVADLRKKKTKAIVVKGKLIDVWGVVSDMDGKIQDHTFNVKVNNVMESIETLMDDAMLDENFYNDEMVKVVDKCSQAKDSVLSWLRKNCPVNIALSPKEDGDPIDLMYKIAKDLSMHIDMVIFSYNKIESEGLIKEDDGKVIIVEKKEEEKNG